MRCSTALFLLFATALPCRGQTVRVYFGTQARGDAKGIYLSELDQKDGVLSKPKLVASLPSAGFLALHPSRRFLYSTTLLSKSREKNGGVAALRIADDGKLELLSRQPSEGRGACHVSVDGTGRCLLVANYGDGAVAALAIGEDGSLRASKSTHQHEGSSVNPRRQKGPHAHSFYAGPDNRFAYAVDLGIDRVLIYELDAESAKLEKVGHAAVPPGSGPRHMKFSRDGKHAYVLNEMGVTISVFERDAKSGALEIVETVSVLPKGDSKERMSCSEIRVHPNGKFVYCANRDLTRENRDSLSVFAVQKDGKLERIQTIGAEVWIPRNFTLDPSGRWLLVAGQRADAVTVFAVDPASGKLEFTGQKVEVPTPMCVVFVEPGRG